MGRFIAYLQGERLEKCATQLDNNNNDMETTCGVNVPSKRSINQNDKAVGVKSYVHEAGDMKYNIHRRTTTAHTQCIATRLFSGNESDDT